VIVRTKGFDRTPTGLDESIDMRESTETEVTDSFFWKDIDCCPSCDGFQTEVPFS
jgi:hypothetical protein